MRNFGIGYIYKDQKFGGFQLLSAKVSPKISRKVMKNLSNKNLAMHCFKIMNENVNKKNPVDLKNVD